METKEKGMMKNVFFGEIMTREHALEKLKLAGGAISHGDYIEAERLTNEALEFVNSDPIEAGEDLGSLRIEVIRMLGIIASMRGDYSLSLEQFNAALELSETDGDKTLMAKIIGNIGVVYQTLSDYPRALERLQTALAINEELGRKDGIATNLGSIGNVYRNFADYPRALEYLLRALSISEEVGGKEGIANNLSSIGLVYANLSDYPRALEYLLKSLSMYEEIASKSGIAVNLGNIGNVYGEEKFDACNPAKALDYLQQALALSEEIGASYPRLHWLVGLGKLYAYSKFDEYDADKAREYLLTAYADSISLGVKHIARDSCNVLYQMYKSQKRWEAAIDIKEKHDDIEKEMNIEEAKKQSDRLDFERKHAEREKQIAVERAIQQAAAEATTNLLHKVLPASVATRIIKGEKVADYFQIVSILFADVVGFTPIAARMPAKSVLAFLNYVFGEFDRIVEKHGCEKIKTIGDGYMAVAGAPIECSDHAERIANAAIEMNADIILPDDIRKTLPKNSVFHIRIGLHCGSAFAGIVGEKRFVYDIYSDAVNLASRMESSGQAGKIHCSSDFAYHLQNRNENFVFEERGEMEIKGKGKMTTYFLENSEL